MEDSHLKSLSLTHSSIHDLKSQICASLEEAAASVNSKREMNKLSAIHFQYVYGELLVNKNNVAASSLIFCVFLSDMQ